VALETAEADLRESAAALEAVRRAAAPGFVFELGSAAADLAMDGSSFEVGFEELPFDSWTSEGPHRVEFLYSPAPGQPPRPLARIASGGEISRVMLALKGVLGEADSVETLVFDEVDAGIGGATAHAVGRRLAELARTHQVIVVTHLAQVAAHATRHLAVRKELRDGSAATTVASIDGDERVAEIARMLSGNDSVASVAHAAELIAGVRAASTSG
jgi:DNA repair protein RecN (Recombination protein N)